MIALTIYQTDLFSKGRYFKSILNESEGEGPPETAYEKGFQEVVNWYDQEFSIIQGRRAAEAAKAKSRHTGILPSGGKKTARPYNQSTHSKKRK